MHTVTQGTLSLNKTSAFYVTTAFANVVYDLTSTDLCTPTSGTITTKIYKSDAATDIVTPLKIMETTFDATNGAVVTGDADATDDLAGSVNKKCDLKDGE